MKIVAFSDWRVQNIEHFIEYLKGLKEKPDVIVYAGDDLERFNNVPYMAIPKILRNRYREELIKIQEPFGKFDRRIVEDIIFPIIRIIYNFKFHFRSMDSISEFYHLIFLHN
ncbi:hypothetical protein LCGC14_1416990 [marine sediment metagenome]|uniref:Uncharacterized protein n=1 Tax=marine sediment metagenome TaxID=412755 RepID=A0A0F9JSZ4_9ZZZZ